VCAREPRTRCRRSCSSCAPARATAGLGMAVPATGDTGRRHPQAAASRFPSSHMQQSSTTRPARGELGEKCFLRPPHVLRRSATPLVVGPDSSSRKSSILFDDPTIIESSSPTSARLVLELGRPPLRVKVAKTFLESKARVDPLRATVGGAHGEQIASAMLLHARSRGVWVSSAYSCKNFPDARRVEPKRIQMIVPGRTRDRRHLHVRAKRRRTTNHPANLVRGRRHPPSRPPIGGPSRATRNTVQLKH